jgi:hypothetical protein
MLSDARELLPSDYGRMAELAVASGDVPHFQFYGESCSILPARQWEDGAPAVCFHAADYLFGCGTGTEATSSFLKPSGQPLTLRAGPELMPALPTGIQREAWVAGLACYGALPPALGLSHLIKLLGREDFYFCKAGLRLHRSRCMPPDRME